MKSIFYIQEYPPKSCVPDTDTLQDFERQTVYTLKDAKDLCSLHPINVMFLNVIKGITQNTTDGWVICFIPASTAAKTAQRYKSLTDVIRKEGYSVEQNAIFKEYDTEPEHCAGKSENPIESFGFDGTKISGKKVILIDDVITRGKTFRMSAEKMRSLGAISVTGIFLAKSTNPKYPFSASDYGFEAADIARLKEAANTGDTAAQFNLGLCYYYGQGVEQDYKEAVKWYTKAAEKGNAGAQLKLGFCYLGGKGVPQDSHNFVHWYAEASNIFNF